MTDYDIINTVITFNIKKTRSDCYETKESNEQE